MVKNFIVKLAQSGIDVKTAGDEHLVYNSNWPLLKIYKQGSITLNRFPEKGGGAFNYSPVISHNLGYSPMFWWFANQSINDYDNHAGVLDTRAEFNGPLLNFPTITSDRMVYSYITQPQNPIQFYYYIFALNLDIPYQAPTIKSGGVIGPRNKNIVFKLAKPNKDISSNNLEDYVINSQARSPMIHAVYPGVVGNDASVPSGLGFTFNHNLGYEPIFFAYAKTGSLPDLNYGINGYILLRPDGTGASGFKVDEQKIQCFDPNIGRHVTLVVLKDPINIDYTVSATV